MSDGLQVPDESLSADGGLLIGLFLSTAGALHGPRS